MAKKRGQNEGSIQKRPNGTWRAQVTLEGKRLSYGAKTRRECQEWLDKTKGQIENGLTFAGSQSSIQEFMEGWLVSMESSLRPDTLVQYRQISRTYIFPNLGRIKLKDLRPDQIQKLYDHQRQSGVGKRTVQIIHAVLHRAMVHAFRLGMIPRNPAGVVTRPKTDHEEMKVYDESQVSEFLLATAGERNEVLFHLAITTGMRQSELVALKWSDLDWNSRQIQVQRQLKSKSGGGYYFAPPKTRAGIRPIVLGKKTIEKLHEHWKRQNQEILAAGEKWSDQGLIFPSTCGTPMDQRNLIRDFKRLIVKAGLPEIRFHDLRHTAASLMLNHGVPVIVASRRLGHSRPSVTLDIYGHLIPGIQNEAADLMDELVTPITVKMDNLREKREAIPHLSEEW